MRLAAATARDAALRAMHEIEVREAYAAQALDRALQRTRLGKPDRALATELVYGATRRRNTVDWYLDQVATRPVAQQESWIRNILRLAAYQIIYLDQIPAHAAVNEAVELAKRYSHAGAAGFVNGVLRSLLRRLPNLKLPDITRDPVRHLSLLYSHPEWMISRWLKRFGVQETARLCEANNAAPPLVVRANSLRTTPEALRERLQQEGVEAEPGVLHPAALRLKGFPSVTGLKAFADGLMTVQDESSMLPASVCGPRRGDHIIDACAGLGSKSTHLAELLENTGRVTACDIYGHKLRLLRESCRRLGVTVVTPLETDARRLGRLMPAQADAVLLDAPCSGLGVLRRRPDARWRRGPEQFAELTELQSELLLACAAAVKPGGVLVYSTCTIEPEENEEQIEQFLARRPDFAPEPLWPYLPSSLWNEPGVDEGRLQLLPHKHDVDGFFVARLRRAGG